MTARTYEKIKKELKQELLKEFILPILRDVKDAEGEYKVSFVKRVLKAAKEKPKYVYNSRTFLRQIGYK